MRASLESRVSILIAGLLFSLFLAVGYVLVLAQRHTLMADKLEEYQALSGMLSLTSVPLADTYDVALYHEFATRFMRADQDISYLVLSDSKGRVLYARSRHSKPHNEADFMGRQAEQVSAVVNRLSAADDTESARYRIPVMVKSGERGYITVGFGSGSVDATMESLRAALLAAFAIALGLGILGAILVAKEAAAPLKKLTKAAGAVAAGDLDASVPVPTSADEARELARSFNHMVVALKDSRDQLIERANTDSLTGLANHRRFHEVLRSEVRRSERYGHTFSLVMLDIDDFKCLNDTCGHLAGDKILQEVAALLVAGSRAEVDTVARYGGEEFAVVLPETDAEHAALVADRIREAVSRHVFIRDDGKALRLTVSMGVAEYRVHSVEPEGILMAADLALYQSKSMGKNRVTIYSTDSQPDSRQDPYRLHLLLSAADAGTIEAMAAAVDAKGSRTPEFSRALVSHALAVGAKLGMSDAELNNLRIAALLHDIGKLAVPDEVLNKKSRLTDSEMEVIRRHPTLGYAIVQKSPHLKSMLPGILYHHERWDGTGYPEGLKRDEIPLVARIIAVVDAYHAMIAHRPHTPPLSAGEARDELRGSSGAQFDPSVVEAFLEILTREDAEQEAA